MSGIITTGTLPKAMWPGINEWWGTDYKELPVEWSDLFDTETSDKAYEEDVGITGFGLAPVKPQGSAIQFDSETQDYLTRYTHVAYALGYIVTWEEMRDNQYEKVARRRTKGLAFSMRQTKETVGANVYNRGFNASYPIGDGAALFSASHPTLAGNQSNLLTAADISEVAIEDACIQIAGALNGRGLKISIMPRSLIVPRQIWFEANRILKSTLQNDTANNAVNVLKATNAIPDGVKMNHYLTDADAWFVRTNAPSGAKHFSRDPIMFGEDNDSDTKNQKYMAYERYSFGVTDWRGVFGNAGA
jgi:hypothetical protein